MMRKSSNRAELMRRVGRMEQVAGVWRFRYAEGKAKGMEGIDVRTGAGLEFTVLPDRALDIFDCRFESRSLCWQSSTGVVAPAYYEREGVQWLRGFGGGLLVTCGLRSVGGPSQNGESFGMHGEISFTPATGVRAAGRWQQDRYLMEISGTVRETSAFGANLVLERCLRTELGATHLEIEDQVSNEGSRREGFMQLYHFNFGHPFLGPDTRVYLAAEQTTARDAEDPRGTQNWDRFGPPEAGFEEQVFLHRVLAGSSGRTKVLLVSDDEARDWGVCLEYGVDDLPWLMQWKQQGEGEYVLGIEPANCTIYGRRHAEEKGLLRYLDAGEASQSRLVFEVLSGRWAVEAAIDEIRQLG